MKIPLRLTFWGLFSHPKLERTDILHAHSGLQFVIFERTNVFKIRAFSAAVGSNCLSGVQRLACSINKLLIVSGPLSCNYAVRNIETSFSLGFNGGCWSQSLLNRLVS